VTKVTTTLVSSDPDGATHWLREALLAELYRACAHPALGAESDPLVFLEEADPTIPGGTPAARTNHVLERLSDYEVLWSRLISSDARSLFLRLLAYHVFGKARVRMPVSLELRATLAAKVETDLLVERCTQRVPGPPYCGEHMDDFDLAPVGFPVELRAQRWDIVQTFLLEQYRWPGPPAIAARSGDIVVDGGACWGDTALYFATRVGPEGRVISFEFEPANVGLLERNLHHNDALAERICFIQAPLWSNSDDVLQMQSLGPSTTSIPEGNLSVRGRALDDVVEEEGIERVDFLKLDVEGAELSALRGAEQTLRRFRPRLAIAVYHQPAQDLTAIPTYLAELGLDYQFALGHFSMSAFETILFGYCPD
jgi:FkbM family methyltransferase